MALVSGKVLLEELQEALGLPKRTVELTFRIARDEVPTVSCAYFPEDVERSIPIIKKFYLMER
jgi:hypothetical protein